MALLVSPVSDVVNNRFLGFLIWQSIQSTAIFIFCKTILLSLFTLNPFSPSVFGCAAFLCFHLSMALFALSIHVTSSPHYHRPASLSELTLAGLRFLFISSPLPPDASWDFRKRVRVSLGIVFIICVSAVSGFIAVVSVVGGSYPGSIRALVGELWLRGGILGLIYGLLYVVKQRWLLLFPIIQRPAFFSFKMGLPLAARQAVMLSVASYVISAMLLVVLPLSHKIETSWGAYLAEQLILYIGSFVVILSWELIHHMHKVLHTRRFSFAPPKGSAAIGTNPSEPLLAVLEESPPRSLQQYLAYLDLSMICGSNIDAWRRAAFFEETGETYKRVLAVCLSPLEQLAMKLAEGLVTAVDNIQKPSHQLHSVDDFQNNSEILESFNDFQLFAWCAQAVASLSVYSHKEDRFGVAQLSGSHADVLSTLLSCLLAVETFMGKKTNLQSPNSVLGPAGIKWATNSTARREIAMAMTKRKDSPMHSKAYALADVLKISVYSIVSEFQEEMVASAKGGVLEKDWLTSTTPVYESREILLQKLKFFLDYRAS